MGDAAETYTYTDAQDQDVDGCMTAINSTRMQRDDKDQLQQVDLVGGTAYYVYDAGGQRGRIILDNGLPAAGVKLVVLNTGFGGAIA